MPKGLYDIQVQYSDNCETQYIYNRAVRLINLAYYDLTTTQNIICSVTGCTFSVVLAGLSIFINDMCKTAIMTSPAEFIFNTPRCLQTGDTIFVNFTGLFNIHENAIIKLNLDDIERIDLINLAYLNAFSITITGVPTNTALIYNDVCVIDPISGGTTVTNIAEIAYI